MEKTSLLVYIFSVVLCGNSFSQITFRGCTTNGLGNQDYTLSNTGTTNDGGTVRNTFESTPSDFGQGCPAGVCEIRMIWNISASRWEVQLDNDGPVGTPDYTTSPLYFNTTASFPNPPDLTLGTWADASGGACPIGELVTLSGDVQSSITLPVELADFKGEVVGNQVSLTWKTLLETNNAYFEVERSANSLDFEPIGIVEGVGSSQSIHAYSFWDLIPLPNASYYRLKQVDFDGKAQHSNIIQVNSLRSDYYVSEFYPNPSSTGFSRLDFHAPENGVVSLLVFNLMGQLLMNEKHVISTGKNELSVDFTSMSPGVFLVKISATNYKRFRKLVIE